VRVPSNDQQAKYHNPDDCGTANIERRRAETWRSCYSWHIRLSSKPDIALIRETWMDNKIICIRSTGREASRLLDNNR